MPGKNTASRRTQILSLQRSCLRFQLGRNCADWVSQECVWRCFIVCAGLVTHACEFECVRVFVYVCVCVCVRECLCV